ncbi:unnamed protein product [Mortierella alpina]
MECSVFEHLFLFFALFFSFLLFLLFLAVSQSCSVSDSDATPTLARATTHRTANSNVFNASAAKLQLFFRQQQQTQGAKTTRTPTNDNIINDKHGICNASLHTCTTKPGQLNRATNKKGGGPHFSALDPVRSTWKWIADSFYFL